MEDIILRLLGTDTVTIQEGTQQLREAFKNPQSIPALCQILTSSNNPQVRQYAAVLLKKRFNRGKHWSQLTDPLKAEIKAMLLQILVNEPVKVVKNAIAQLIGVILKHELPHNKWPEILTLIRGLLSSGQLANQELGMYTLSIMTDIAPSIYLPHCQTILELINYTVNSFTDLANPVSCYILEIMLHLIPLVEGNQIMVNAYHQFIPKVIQIIQALSTVNEEKAVKGFELLDELCETAPSVLSSHVKSLVDMCLSLANHKSLSNELRSKSVAFIGWLTKIKKKAIVKHRLVEPIVDMLFSQMSVKPDDEEQEVYFTGEEDNTPITCAAQTLDLLALHLPPEKLIPYTLQHVEPGLKGTDPYAKKASYLAMAVLAEGCSEHIRYKYLETFLRCICQGITDPAPVVRNAALFALGQFSEHLQPEISRYADELVPVLLQHLSQVCAQIRQEKKDLPSADRMFYAFEMFAENLNEGLLPYLPTLMSILFEILSDSTSPMHICELALSAIGSAAEASKENMMPYFEQIINILMNYLNLSKDRDADENMTLQVQAVDTLGVLARTVGEQNFAPIAMKSLEIGMALLKSTEDPDLKKAVYGLLASLSMVIKKEMSIVLPELIEFLTASVQSTEGIVPCFKDEENADYLVYDDETSENEEEDIEISDNEDEGDDEDDVVAYDVENAYVEEKEEAILALREIAEHTGETFIPYLERAFEEVFHVVNYPQEDIRKAVIDALTQFCISYSKVQTEEGKYTTQNFLSVVIPKLSELIRLDQERSVVIQALDAYAELLEHIKSDVIVCDGHKDAIMSCVLDVMNGRTACQDEDDGSAADEGEAEHDVLMFECAAQVLTNLGKAMETHVYALFVQRVFPILIKRLKNNHSDSQRSFCIGTISECIPCLNNYVGEFVPTLYPLFIKYASDSCDEVRNNSIFGLGELAFYAKDILYPQYNEILQTLSNAVANETSALVRDNIIGAICRLIIRNHSIVPIEQVFPVLISHLPLKEDQEENKTAFECIQSLYSIGHAIIKPNLERLLHICFETLELKDCACETLIVDWMKQVRNDFPDEWSAVCSKFTREQLEVFYQLML